MESRWTPLTIMYVGCARIFSVEKVLHAVTTDKGLVWQISYNFLLDLTVGYLMFKICRRWFR